MKRYSLLPPTVVFPAILLRSAVCDATNFARIVPRVLTRGRTISASDNLNAVQARRVPSKVNEVVAVCHIKLR